MAVTKTLNVAVPYLEDGKVVKWDLGMKYEQGTEGQADYYASEKSVPLMLLKHAPALMET